MFATFVYLPSATSSSSSQSDLARQAAWRIAKLQDFSELITGSDSGELVAYQTVDSV